MSRLCALFLLILLASTGCSSRLLPPPDHHPYNDERPIAKPRKRSPFLAVEIVDKTFSYQLKQALDLPRNARKLIGHPYQALNVDRFDQVPNSAWFSNRNGAAPMSLEAIRRGPNRSYGPDTTGAWTVVALKSVGVTPGMTIVDARGDRYIIKFDPPDFPELSSGTEAVAARLFYAAGYNVPENYIAHLDPSWLVPAAEAVMTVETDDRRDPISKRQMFQEDLEAILRQVNPAGRQRGSGCWPAVFSTAFPWAPGPIQGCGGTIPTTSTRTSTGGRYAASTSLPRGSTTPI